MPFLAITNDTVPRIGSNGEFYNNKNESKNNHDNVCHRRTDESNFHNNRPLTHFRVRKSSFAMWFWSHQGKLGKKKAIIAVARKILTLTYKLLKSGEFYNSTIALKAYSSPPLNNSLD